MKYYSAKDIKHALDFPSLIEALRKGFTVKYTIPSRMHLHYDNETDNNQNTLLLMPAVKCGDVTGVKIVTVTPGNSKRNLPSIQGIYYLMDAVSGSPKALMEAKMLTNWRTAATSALAASYLAPENATCHLMIGTGSLAPFIVDAHRTNRLIKELLIYGRNKTRALALANLKTGIYEKITIVDDLKEAVHKADIISVATLSPTPLIKGVWLRPGQHIDLIGAYKPDMRESDDEVLLRSRVFVDNLETAPKETGDLAIPIANGTFSVSAIQGDLFQLAKGQVKGRNSLDEITVFKSVGHALEDLVAAQLVVAN